MFLANLFGLEFRRRRLLARTPPGPLHAFLSVPFPSPREDCKTVEFVAVDLETTGLDARKDEILSVGRVNLSGRGIRLGTASNRLVIPDGSIPEQSAVIHQITDDAAAGGEPLANVLADLLATLAGKVMIAHHARVEMQFIGAACERLYGSRFLIPVVDTQWIERRALLRRNRAIMAGDLRLARLREKYNLPRYRAHDALSDALAAGELFLAQLAERDTGSALPLKDFLLNR